MAFRPSVMVILMLMGGLVIIAPVLTAGTYHTHLASSVLIFSIAAIGLNILTGYAGQLSLAQAAFMAVGAYITALFSKTLGSTPFLVHSGLHVWVGIIAGTTGAALCGGILAVPALRVRGPYLAMTTIAFGWIVWKILLEWVPVTGGDLGISAIPKPQIGGWRLEERAFYFLVLALFVATLEVQRRLTASRFGLLIRGIKHAELAVRAVGVDVSRVKFATFVISSAIAGLAGALFAHQQAYINPDSFQVFDSVFILLIVLFGGAGTMFGPVVGAAVLVLLPEMLHGLQGYRLIVYGGLLLLTLYFVPRGLMGEVLRRIEGKRVRRPERSSVPHNLETAAEVNKGGMGSLRIEGVSRSFGGLVALDRVSLRVASGSVHALIGPNGAGKTTLLNIVTGFYPAECGRVVLDDVQVTSRSLDAAARLGIVRTFQNIKPIGDMTAIEHVLLGLSGQDGSGLDRTLLSSKGNREQWSRQREKARDILSLLGIAHLEESPATALSHGHRRLVEIARALAARPRVLLLDEPAAGLAMHEVQELAAILQRLNAIGMTILLVEHNMEFVLEVSDRITVLDHGVVIADGAPGNIMKNQRVIDAYLGTYDAASGN